MLGGAAALVAVSHEDVLTRKRLVDFRLHVFSDLDAHRSLGSGCGCRAEPSGYVKMPAHRLASGMNPNRRQLHLLSYLCCVAINFT